MSINLSAKAMLILLISVLYASTARGGGEPIVVIPSEDGVQRVDIVVDSYEFRPKHIAVKAGHPVEITLRSVTLLIPHNFTLVAPGAGLDIKADVPAHADVRVRFTPERTGAFEFYCDKGSVILGNHRDKGMEGILEVRD